MTGVQTCALPICTACTSGVLAAAQSAMVSIFAAGATLIAFYSPIMMVLLSSLTRLCRPAACLILLQLAVAGSFLHAGTLKDFKKDVKKEQKNNRPAKNEPEKSSSTEQKSEPSECSFGAASTGRSHRSSSASCIASCCCAGVFVQGWAPSCSFRCSASCFSRSRHSVRSWPSLVGPSRSRSPFRRPDAAD